LRVAARPRVAGLILLDPLPDEFLAQLADQPPAVKAALRAKTVEAPDASPGLMLETEKSIESAMQVRGRPCQQRPCPMSRWWCLQSNTPNPQASGGAMRRSPNGTATDVSSSSVRHLI